MATIPGIPGDERQVSPAVQAERDQERLRILQAERADQRLPAEARAAVGREIDRMAPKVPGMLEPGNIDLGARPKVKNKDGSISTVRSWGVNIDGVEVLLPTVSDDGRIMEDDEAIETYRRTGKHLGKFATAEASTEYAQRLHVDQEQFYLGPQADPELEDLRRRRAEADAAAGGGDGMLRNYGRALDAAVMDRLISPPPVPEPDWSVWSSIKALGAGPVSGGFDYAGSVADLASGAATPLAATGGSAGGMFALPSDDERRQEDEARKRMLTGPAFDPTMGNEMRAASRAWSPDPLSSHRSTQILHGLSSGVSKAVASAVTFGGIPGAVVFGAEEGNTVAQNLITEGVDPETAAKVGVVTGLASGVGAGLPVAGGTWAKTAALAAVGGPGTYVAQEALSKQILQEVGYTAQAEMHDPTDPVMLALSVAVPGATGAVAMRGVRAAKARAAAAEKVAATQRGAAQARRDAAALAEAADIDQVAAAGAMIPDADVVARAADDPAAVDAARVRALEDAEAKHIPPDAPPGAERGIDAVRESVESGDMRPLEAMVAQQDVPTVRALEAGAPRWFSGAPAGLAELQPSLAREGNLYGPGVYVARNADFADTYGRGEGRTVYEVDFAPQRPFNTADIQPRAEADRVLASLGVPKAKIAAALGKKPKVANDTLYKALADGLGGKAKANQALAAAGYDAILFKSNRGDELAVALKPVKTSPRAEAPPGAAPEPAAGRPTATTPDPMPGQPPAARAQQADAAAGPESGPAASDTKAVAALEQADPDMLVTLPGSEAPVRLADALEQIKAQADEMKQEGDLFAAAAECALLSGV